MCSQFSAKSFYVFSSSQHNTFIILLLLLSALSDEDVEEGKLDPSSHIVSESKNLESEAGLPLQGFLLV